MNIGLIFGAVPMSHKKQWQFQWGGDQVAYTKQTLADDDSQRWNFTSSREIRYIPITSPYITIFCSIETHWKGTCHGCSSFFSGTIQSVNPRKKCHENLWTKTSSKKNNSGCTHFVQIAGAIWTYLGGPYTHADHLRCHVQIASTVQVFWYRLTGQSTAKQRSIY